MTETRLRLIARVGYFLIGIMIGTLLMGCASEYLTEPDLDVPDEPVYDYEMFWDSLDISRFIAIINEQNERERERAEYERWLDSMVAEHDDLEIISVNASDVICTGRIAGVN